MTLNKILIPIIILILTFQLTNAMGYGFSEESLLPVKAEPGLTKTFGYSIVPTSPNVMNYSISTEGNLSKYITVNPPEFILNVQPNERPSLVVTLNLPDPLPADITPGLHEVFVNVVEEFGEGGGMFIVRSGARIKIKILSLYEGKYLTEPKVLIPNINEGDNINASITISNYGKEKINSVYAKIEVIDKNNAVLTSFNTNTISLDSQEIATITGTTKSDITSGEYNVKVTVFGDDKTMMTDSALKVGTLRIDINDFTKELKKDSINEFNINIQSFWNNQLNNVYGEIEINNKKIQTPSINLNPWQQITLSTYVNSQNMDAGDYPVIIKVYYENKEIASKQGTITIIKQEETQKVTENTSNSNSFYMIIMIIAIAIILIGLNLFWMINKNKKIKNTNIHPNKKNNKKK